MLVLKRSAMQKQIHPAVAVAVIAVVALAIGGFLYYKSSTGGKPMKPSEMMKNPKLRAAISEEFRKKYGDGSGNGGGSGQ